MKKAQRKAEAGRPKPRKNTPALNKDSFDAVRVQDISDRDFVEIGMFEFIVNGNKEICGMLTALPDPDTRLGVGGCMFENYGGPGPKWEWNGDVNKPTLSPSIRRYCSRRDGTAWHGYLRNGRFENCER